MEEIIELDPEEAATLFSAVQIVRETPHVELGMAELENQISEAIWQLFDRARGEAALRFGVNEVDVLLTDARIMGVKIDGHQVLNPHGFNGKTLELSLVITMVKRESFVPSAYLLEGGSVRAYLLAKKHGVDRALYFEVAPSRTAMYVVEPSKISYADGFKWGTGHAVGSVVDELEVSEPAAEEIYRRYVTGEVSPHVKKKLDDVFFGAFSDFVRGAASGIESVMQGGSRKLPPLYLQSLSPIPNDVHERRFALGKRRVSFQKAEGIGDLADFLKDEVHSTYAELNQLASRRIRWLMPTN